MYSNVHEMEKLFMKMEAKLRMMKLKGKEMFFPVLIS